MYAAPTPEPNKGDRMSRIVAGRFERSIDADAALAALRGEGFADAEISSFAVNPPGQHAMTPIGGDVHADAGARGAGWTAVIGAALGLVVGLVVGSIASLHLGTPALFFIGALGAFVGAFAGVMSRLHHPRRSEGTAEHPAREMPAGRMIAVCVDRAGTEEHAVAVLRRHGARDVGRAQGQWRDGGWRDFDPRRPLAAV
jgi:hypothetical protein